MFFAANQWCESHRVTLTRNLINMTSQPQIGRLFPPFTTIEYFSPTKAEPTVTSGTRSQSRPGTSKSSRATPTISESPRYSRRSSPVTKGKISVFNIRRPDHTAAKTERIR